MQCCRGVPVVLRRCVCCFAEVCLLSCEVVVVVALSLPELAEEKNAMSSLVLLFLLVAVAALLFGCVVVVVVVGAVVVVVVVVVDCCCSPVSTALLFISVQRCSVCLVLEVQLFSCVFVAACVSSEAQLAVIVINFLFCY